jgi:hypothetical protein
MNLSTRSKNLGRDGSRTGPTDATALIVGTLACAPTLKPPALLLAGVTTDAVVYVAMAFLLRVEAVTQTSFELIGMLAGRSVRS